MSASYVVVTPARDEERTIERTIESMVAQTVRPLRWVIVDDGSTDATRSLVEKHLPANPWMELVVRSNRGFRALGGGVVEAFEEGLARVRDLPWDFVVKLDADLSFQPGYFEGLIRRFAADQTLGMASGKTFLVEGGTKSLEWCPDDHVRGPAKMYRRSCFEAIGGLEARRGWDMIDETRARMRGFTTKSFLAADVELIHHRPIDARQTNVLKSRYEMGKLYHFLGYHWLYHAIRSARSALQDFPRGVGGAALFAGFVAAALRRTPRLDPAYTAFVQKEQRARFRWDYFRAFLRTTRKRPKEEEGR
jgi:glycosyltransferase involved in cell wall biosynthesis